MPILKASLESMHSEVLAYLKEQKAQNPDYRVLDVGGVAMPWAHEVNPDYLDIQPGATIVGDACLCKTWERVGQYDYSICTQTLEDLRDPYFVILELFQHSRAGFIGTPHKHTELGLREWQNVLGYCHHRWIFTIQNNRLRIMAKWPAAQALAPEGHLGGDYLKWLRHDLIGHGELNFTWAESFEAGYVREDFPGLAAEGCDGILRMYQNELAEGL